MRFLSIHDILGFYYLSDSAMNNKSLIDFLKNLSLPEILFGVLSNLLVPFCIVIYESGILKINAVFSFIVSFF